MDNGISKLELRDTGAVPGLRHDKTLFCAFFSFMTHLSYFTHMKQQQEGTNTNRWLETIIVCFFCFAVILGPAYTLFDSYSYDVVANPDIRTYLGLAEFDLDQNPVRKYRVIVPFLAAGVNFVFSPVFNALAPATFPGPDFSLCISFLVVNSVLMSLFGMLVYQLCRAFGVSHLAAGVGVLGVLTCRWTAYLAGLPLVDSLYMVVVALTLLAIQTRNEKLAVIAIFLGPWAKEAFIFLAPLLFFFSGMNKWKQVLLFFLSACLVFAFRYGMDSMTGSTVNMGLQHSFSHWQYIPDALVRLFSFHGLYEIFSVVGIWGICFLFLFKRQVRETVKKNTKMYLILFLGIVLVHILLSGELARMLYIATPVMAIWISVIVSSLFSSRQEISDNL